MSVPVIFALTRHGEYHQPKGVPSAWLPHPLTELGQTQAKTLGDEIYKQATQHGWQLDPRVDCSVLLRAYQTAQLATHQLHALSPSPQALTLCPTLALCERSLGSAANLSVSEIESVLERDPRYERPAPGWKSRPSFRLPLPGAESLLEAGLRVAQYLRQQARDIALAQTQLDNASTPVMRIVVAHGACLRWAAYHLGLMTLEQTMACSMYHAKSVWVARHDEDSWSHVAGSWKPRTQPAQD